MSYTQEPLPQVGEELLPLPISIIRVKQLRQEHNVSLGKFFKLFVDDLSYETVKRIERGEKVRYSTAMQALKAYNTMLGVYDKTPLTLEESQINIQ